MFFLAALIVLHSATGVQIDINPNEITNLRRPEPGNPSFTPDVKCMINLTDGKFVTVRETCEEVRRAIDPQQQRRHKK